MPADVTAQSVPQLDRVKGPVETEQVPRRILECLRTQLDAIATEWATNHAAEATKEDLRQQANAFAETILDQAKRIQERKRVADPAADAKVAKSAPSAEPAAQAL